MTFHKHFSVQDAFQSLQNASSTAWKNTIRVSFINQQGLAEAGIDQNGIFKEFIQEVIRIAFDPAFNLFKVRFRDVWRGMNDVLCGLGDGKSNVVSFADF